MKTIHEELLPTKEIGSLWFRRLKKEAEHLSLHIRFKRIKMGFWRIYYKGAYVHEVYQEMPLKGYDREEEDPRFENHKYYQEFEDQAELTRKIKNYVEGYVDSIKKIKVRIVNMRNDKEAYETARRAYSQMRII